MLKTSLADQFQEQFDISRADIPQFGTDKKRNEATLDSANFSFCNSDIQQSDRYLDDTLNMKQLEVERGLFKMSHANMPKMSDILKQSWSRIKQSSDSRRTFNNIEIDTIAQQKIIPYINQHFLNRTVSTASCRSRGSSPRIINRSSIRKNQENKRKFRLGIKLEKIEQFLIVRKAFNTLKQYKPPSLQSSRQSSSFFQRNRSLQLKIMAKYCRKSLLFQGFSMIKSWKQQSNRKKYQQAIYRLDKIVQQKNIKNLYHAVLRISVFTHNTDEIEIKEQHYVELNYSLPIQCVSIETPMGGSKMFAKERMYRPLKPRPKDLECSYLGHDVVRMLDRKLQQI